MEHDEPKSGQEITWKSYKKKHLRLALEQTGLLQPGHRLSYTQQENSGSK